ncbi:MAG: hypothetical protein AB7D47_06785 [Desulfovibrio sp.]|jgi:CMP-N-acetylneuraminic acid synthetase
MTSKSILAVIPARGGSKGIPGKNIKTVGGITLVAHAARSAIEAGCFDALLLSTDDEAIAEAGRSAGLDVPFLRPAHLATDNANSLEMWQHAWRAAEEYYAMRFDFSALLQPTSPLRNGKDILATLHPVLEGKASSAMTVTPTPGHFTPHKAKLITQDGTIVHYMNDCDVKSLRQDIPPMYFPNGYCYAVTRQQLLDDGVIIGPDCAAIVIDNPVVNIDDPWELEFAEFLWSTRQ